jgi:hypothetical protein
LDSKTRRPRDNYINYLKNIMEEVPEKERQGLKESIDEDFELFELAINGGRNVKKEKKKERGRCLLSTVFAILRDGWGLIGFD